MAMGRLEFRARCIAHAFDSLNAVQYFPGDVVDFSITEDKAIAKNITNGMETPFSRQLLWLRTPRGRWVFEFDRAGCSDPSLRLWFCKDCGQPFDRLNEHGTHVNQYHSNKTIAAGKAQAAELDVEEERLVQEQIAAASVAEGPVPTDVSKETQSRLQKAIDEQRAKVAVGA
jgi:hypothetical protein